MALPDEDARHALELMRTIVAEAKGWDPHVTIEYRPGEAVAGRSPFYVTLDVKGYRRRDRRRVTRGRTAGEAMEHAMAEFRMAQD